MTNINPELPVPLPEGLTGISKMTRTHLAYDCARATLFKERIDIKKGIHYRLFRIDSIHTCYTRWNVSWTDKTTTVGVTYRTKTRAEEVWNALVGDRSQLAFEEGLEAAALLMEDKLQNIPLLAKGVAEEIRALKRKSRT